MKVWTIVLSLNGDPPSFCLSVFSCFICVMEEGSDITIKMLTLQAHEDLNLIPGIFVKKPGEVSKPISPNKYAYEQHCNGYTQL